MIKLPVQRSYLDLKDICLARDKPMRNTKPPSIYSSVVRGRLFPDPLADAMAVLRGSSAVSVYDNVQNTT